MGTKDTSNNRAVLDALKGLQEKIRVLEDERTRIVEEVKALKRELARRQEDHSYTQQLHDLTLQEQDAASRLAYERLLADKSAVDIRLDETEKDRLDLQQACATARAQEQEAVIAQMSAEAKVGTLEERVQESEQNGRTRKKKRSKVRETIRRVTAATDAQLSSLITRVEELDCTLREARSGRKIAEMNVQQAKSATVRTNRYLDDILQVNQEVVSMASSRAAPDGRQPTHHATHQVHQIATKSTGPSLTTASSGKRQYQSSRSYHRSKSKPRQRNSGSTRKDREHQQKEVISNCSDNNSNSSSSEDSQAQPSYAGGIIDVGSAVGETFQVARSGGDPVPSLQALYERIGFSAIVHDQEEDGDEIMRTQNQGEGVAGSGGGCATTADATGVFMPTSPRYRRNNASPTRRHTNSPKERKQLGGREEERYHCEKNKRLFRQPLNQDSTEDAAGGTDGRQPWSSLGWRRGDHTGNSAWDTGCTDSGYSFAHSPQARTLSGAERWPKMVKRLEDLAFQLEAERSDVERWYKKVVHEAKPDMDVNGKKMQQGKHRFDTGCLTRAIACLQDKTEQLDVVRESLGTLQASPKSPVTLSPVDSRRKAAAMHALRARAKA